MSIARLGRSIFLISYCLPTDYARAFSCIKSVCFLNHKNSNYYSERSGVKLLAGTGLELPGSVRGSRGLLAQSWALHKDAGGLLEMATCFTRRYSLGSSTRQRRVRGKIYKPNFFPTTKLRARSLLSGARHSSPQRREREKIRISNS